MTNEEYYDYDFPPVESLIERYSKRDLVQRPGRDKRKYTKYLKNPKHLGKTKTLRDHRR